MPQSGYRTTVLIIVQRIPLCWIFVCKYSPPLKLQPHLFSVIIVPPLLECCIHKVKFVNLWNFWTTKFRTTNSDSIVQLSFVPQDESYRDAYKGGKKNIHTHLGNLKGHWVTFTTWVQVPGSWSLPGLSVEGILGRKFGRVKGSYFSSLWIFQEHWVRDWIPSLL